jgi:hypothetical protein
MPDTTIADKTLTFASMEVALLSTDAIPETTIADNALILASKTALTDALSDISFDTLLTRLVYSVLVMLPPAPAALLVLTLFTRLRYSTLVILPLPVDDATLANPS